MQKIIGSSNLSSLDSFSSPAVDLFPSCSPFTIKGKNPLREIVLIVLKLELAFHLKQDLIGDHFPF